MTVPQKIRDVYQKATCLYTAEQVTAALDKMAINIHAELEHKNPIVLCVMIGGLIPMGQLLTRLDFPLEVDYVHATRYQGKTQAAELEWKAKPQSALTGRTVLVVDDILDGGITLATIIDYCKKQGADEVYSAVLVDKPMKRIPEGLPHADFVGLDVEDHYIFGYGLDYNEYLRNVPGIYKVAPEHE